MNGSHWVGHCPGCCDKCITETTHICPPSSLGRKPLPDTSKVTRFELIDWRGTGSSSRRVVEYGVTVMVDLQDDDRTLKVFLTDRTEGGDQ